MVTLMNLFVCTFCKKIIVRIPLFYLLQRRKSTVVFEKIFYFETYEQENVFRIRYLFLISY